MPSRERPEILAGIEHALLELSPTQLGSVLDLVTFLASHPMTQPDESLEVIEPPEAPETPAASGGDDYASLAFLVLLAFGDIPLPDEAMSLPDNPLYKRLHDVPLLPQQQSEWCWAATAHMILAYHGDVDLPDTPEAAQLELVRSVDPARRRELNAERLNRGGWPPFWEWGFESSVVENPETLSTEQAQAEIDAGRPFAISWHYAGRSGHMLVIVGYLWIGDILWLVAHDPWPAGQDGGDRSLISHDHYTHGLAGTWRTYHGVQPASGPLGPHRRFKDRPVKPAPEPAGDPQAGDPQAGDSQTIGWMAFLEALSDSEQRNQIIGQAISLIRCLARPESIVSDSGIFSSEPGDPNQIHFLHALPVLQLPRHLDLSDEDAMLNIFSKFKRAIVIVGGEHGHLTSITIRQTRPGGPWKVIRLGRSHMVKAFDKLRRLFVEGVTISAGGEQINPSEHLSHLPLAIFRMPDARQYLLLTEVLGPPRHNVPFLLFPIYDDSDLGFEQGRTLTLDDLQKALEWTARRDEASSEAIP